MKTIQHIIGLLLVVALFTGCSKQEKADSLPKKDTIRALIPEEFGIHRILLGDQIVHNREDDFDNRRISQGEFNEVKAWADVGLIRLHSNEILGDNSNFNWDDWNRRMVQGQMMDIRVELTEKGRKLDSSTRTKERLEGWAYGRFLDQKVDDIVSMELQQQAGSNYCIVNAIVSEELTLVGAEVYGAMGMNRAKKTKYKVIWLLKHDPFDKAWKAIAMDSAPEGEDIKSNNVNQALLNAK